MLAFGANFDYDGLYNFRGLSWPASFTGTSLQSLADAEFYHCGSLDAYKDMFKTSGKTWATLRDLAAAHVHFGEIKGTGVLGIFPFGQESTTLKVPAVTLANSCPIHNKCRHAICLAGAGVKLRWQMHCTANHLSPQTSNPLTQLARQMTASELMALIVRPAGGPFQLLLKQLKPVNAHPVTHKPQIAYG